MGFSFRMFLLDQADALYRLPHKKFGQMLLDPKSYCLARFAGTRMRMTDVGIKLVNRQPICVVRITFSFVAFDAEGYFDAGAFLRHQYARAEAGWDGQATEPGSNGKVVDASTRFVAQGRLWTPSRSLSRLIDEAALGRGKYTRL